MSDNFNIDTTQAQSYVAGGLDPSNPELTIGDTVAQNAQQQAEHAQLVQQAVERTKQAKLSTKQKTQADAEGVNPELENYMSKAEALQYIAHEWKVDESDPEIQKLADTLPEQVERHMIQTLIRKKDRFPSRPVGQPFQAKEGQSYPTDQSGTGAAQLQPGQWYQPMVDDGGAVSYIPSGQSGAALRAGSHGDDQTSKEWVKIADEMDPTKASSRNALGINYQSYVAAMRGENLLNQPIITYQNLGEVTRDLTRILQQGVPTDSGTEGMMYHSLVGDIMKKIQYIGGNPKDAVPQGLKDYLKDSFERLKAISKDVIELKIQAKEAAFPDVIQANQNKWDNLTHVLRNPPITNMEARQPGTIGNEGGPAAQLWHRITGGGQSADAAPAPAAPAADSNDPLGIL